MLAEQKTEMGFVIGLNLNEYVIIAFMKLWSLKGIQLVALPSVKSNFTLSSIASKVIGDGAVIALGGLIVAASYYQEIWLQIPLMERFAFIPWILFIYTYYICAKIEDAQGLSKIKNKPKKRNYYYTLWWGSFFLVFHYLYILFDLNPSLKVGFATPIYEAYVVYYKGMNGFAFSDAPSQAFSVLQSAGLIIALYGAILATKSRIHLNGYWAINIHDYGSENKVICSGPYARVRHPIYLGQNLLVFGTAIVTADLFFYIFLLLVFSLNRARAKVEERELIEIFQKRDGRGKKMKNEYKKYMEDTYFMINQIY